MKHLNIIILLIGFSLVYSQPNKVSSILNDYSDLFERKDDLLLFKKIPYSGQVLYKHNDNSPDTIESYIDGKLNGELIVFNGSNIKLKARLVGDKKEGLEYLYYDSGEPYRIGNYYHNQRDGVWTWFYKNGNLQEAGSYSNGLKIGSWNTFYDSGKIQSIIEFNSKGKIYGTYFYESGKLKKEGEFIREKNYEYEPLKFGNHGGVLFLADPLNSLNEADIWIEYEESGFPIYLQSNKKSWLNFDSHLSQ